MVDLESCIALSGLTEEEVAAIAEREHVPTVVAAALGSYLTRLPEGPERICEIFADDIRAAQQRGDHAHAARLKLALRHFLEQQGQAG